MIPFAAEIHIRSRMQRHFNLWVPLAVLWILLFPLVLLLLPILMIGCLVVRIAPFRAIATLWGILTSMADTELAIEFTDRSFSMHLY
ncbi:MAG TPA: hypothetical protein VMJ34_06265 [Bryobacteraceae bacterium]|nr:hypothetical protein [Bryobacteraceae bacterium]